MHYDINNRAKGGATGIRINNDNQKVVDHVELIVRYDFHQVIRQELSTNIKSDNLWNGKYSLEGVKCSCRSSLWFKNVRVKDIPRLESPFLHEMVQYE